MAPPRILVTNDDGIDSVGLHVLARVMRKVGEVMVVAPDQEYSGAGAAIGALHVIKPEAHAVSIDGIDTAWTVSGPPGLCVMFARLGAFGPLPDLIVSGINPGANVGRAVYHSGTIGACLTGRNGFIPGVAVSQSVADFGVEGQGWDEMLAGQKWETAAAVAAEVAAAMVATETSDTSETSETSDLPDTGVLNLNVPNLELGELKGWRWTEVGQSPPRAMSKAVLEPKLGHDGAYKISLSWGDEQTQPEDTDTGAIQADLVSVTWLSRIFALGWSTPEVDKALDGLMPGS